MEIKAIARRWGSSIAVIIPKQVIDQRRIAENDEIIIEIKQKQTTGDFFGRFKNWKTPTQKLKDEMRKGW